MKLLLILLLALMAFEGRVFAGLETDVAQTNRVILASGRWNSSADDTQKALVAIQTFLEKRANGYA